MKRITRLIGIVIIVPSKVVYFLGRKVCHSSRGSWMAPVANHQQLLGQAASMDHHRPPCEEENP
eukprot:1545441-Amphidinium_carterae.1